MKRAKVTVPNLALAAPGGVLLGAAASTVVSGMRASIQPLVPSDFYWWMEIDSDVGVSIRWVWLGHPSVVHVGGVQDFDLSIVLTLLRGVNWFVERQRAIESVEGYEAEALKAAQTRRRQKIVRGDAKPLAPVEIPPPPPVSLEAKRAVRRAGLARAGYDAAIQEKTRKLLAKEHAPAPSYKSRKSVAGLSYGLTKSRALSPGLWVWQRYESRDEMMEALVTEPPGTFTHVCFHEVVTDCVDKWREAWESTRETRELDGLIARMEDEGRDTSELRKKLRALTGSP